MKILITGAGGWLGSELTKQLLERGENVRAFVLKESEKLKSLKKQYNENLEIIIGDICKESDISKAIKGTNKVFHLAAKVHCQCKNQKDINEFYKVNTEASKIVFEKCLEEKVERVIFYSSVSVYGDSEEVITINSKKNPNTPYAKSKLLAEKIGIDLYKKLGLPLTIIQPVTVYGGDDIGNFEKMKSFSKKGFLPRFGDGLNKKTVIYFKDLIKMTINISTNDNLIGETIICGNETITLNNIIETFNKNGTIKIIKINSFFSDAIIKIFSFKSISPFNKIARQIYVLKSNNEIKSNYRCEEYTKFNEYYG